MKLENRIFYVVENNKTASGLIETLIQIKTFTKYNFNLMDPLMYHNWPVFFLDVNFLVHVVKSKTS